MRTLVLGGIRSGKSSWAEEAIAESAAGGSVRYLATGPSADADAGWVQRIDAHRRRRPDDWTTVESTDVAAELNRATGVATLVDDIGGWLTAAMDRRDGWENGSVAADVGDLLSAVEGFGSPLVLVSPEVGWTVVPETRSGRRFADELGELNQRLAAVCDSVILVVAGLPVRLKPEGRMT